MSNHRRLWSFLPWCVYVWVIALSLDFGDSLFSEPRSTILRSTFSGGNSVNWFQGIRPTKDTWWVTLRPSAFLGANCVADWEICDWPLHDITRQIYNIIHVRFLDDDTFFSLYNIYVCCQPNSNFYYSHKPANSRLLDFTWKCCREWIPIQRKV